MQTDDCLLTEQLEIILGVDREFAIHSLAQKQGVSIQSVEGFCKAVRLHVSALPKETLLKVGDKIPLTICGIVRQHASGEILSYKNNDDEHSVIIEGDIGFAHLTTDKYGALNIAEASRQAALDQYIKKIMFTSSRGVVKRWTLDELLDSGAQLFLHGLITDPTEEQPAVIGVFMSLWVSDDVLIDPGTEEMASPDWNSIEFCIKEQVEGDRNYGVTSRAVLQHIYDYPRDVAPVNQPPKDREYSTLIPK